MRQVVLGAGPLGVSLERILRAAGHDVDLYSIMANLAYDMPGTTPRVIDGADVEAVISACADAAVVYLCLNAHYVDWYGLFPPRLDAAIEAATTTGAMLVYHDTLHCFEHGPEPLTETTPALAKTRKGRLRAEMAATFLKAVGESKIRGAIGRSADMYGPGALNSSFNSTLGQRHFYPLLAGKAVSIVGNIDAPHTYAFVDDVAYGLATLGNHNEAIGRTWHLPAAPTLTHRQLIQLAFDIAGLPPKIRGSRVSGLFVRAIGRFNADVGEVAEILDQFEQPLVLSHQAFADTFGADPTPHSTALQTTLDWYKANPLP
ncbi:MAG: NAD-dependent epimerase/dehydratase family protein [Acidimicrobiales bacterium]